MAEKSSGQPRACSTMADYLVSGLQYPLSARHHYTLNVSTQQGAAQVSSHRPACKILCRVNLNLGKGDSHADLYTHDIYLNSQA